MKQINGLRFIVGNGCNYNCFYCHHEGYFNKNKININIENLKKLKKFTLKNNISNISITGGEPFLYWENTKKILSVSEEANIWINEIIKDVSIIDIIRRIEFEIECKPLFRKLIDPIDKDTIEYKSPCITACYKALTNRPLEIEFSDVKKKE